jgi:hypothetical protein
MPHGAPGFIDKNAVAKAAECLPFGQYRIWINILQPTGISKGTSLSTTE